MEYTAKNLLPKTKMGRAYKMGFDCGVNGPNQTNCHFTIFCCPENTRAWEAGKRDAEQEANLQ